MPRPRRNPDLSVRLVAYVDPAVLREIEAEHPEAPLGVVIEGLWRSRDRHPTSRRLDQRDREALSLKTPVQVPKSPKPAVSGLKHLRGWVNGGFQCKRCDSRDETAPCNPK